MSLKIIIEDNKNAPKISFGVLRYWFITARRH